MTWTGAYSVFAVFKNVHFFESDEFVIAIQRAFRAHFMCVRMMLFRIENRYCYALKISELLVHQLKEFHQEDFEHQKIAGLWHSMLCDFLHVQSINMLLLWDCLIEQLEEFYKPS